MTLTMVDLTRVLVALTLLILFAHVLVSCVRNSLKI
jgi:hypothetical protein